MAAMAAMAALSAASQLLGGSMQAKAENMAAKAKNEAIMAYNKQVMAQTAQEVSQLNMQRAQAIRGTSAALFNIKQAEVAAKDEAQSYAAFNDNIGASTGDVANSVAVQSDRSQADAMTQLDYTNEGMNLMLRNITQNGANSFQQEYRSQYKNIIKQAVVGAVGSAANTMMMGGGKK